MKPTISDYLLAIWSIFVILAVAFSILGVIGLLFFVVPPVYVIGGLVGLFAFIVFGILTHETAESIARDRAARKNDQEGQH